MDNSLKKNISKIFALNSAWMFLIILPIIVPFYRSKGLSMQEVFELQSFFSLIVLIFELPSGYVADLIGRKNTLISASLFQGVGFSLLPFFDHYWGLIFVQLLLGIGVSLFSGTDISIIYDSLHAMKNRIFNGSEAKLIGKKIFYTQTSEAIAALVGGALVVSSLDTPVKVQAFICWIPFLISLTVTEPPREKLSSSAHGDNWREISKKLFKSGPLIKFILFNNIIYSAATLLAVWTFQDYWHSLGVDYKYFGYLWCLTNFSVGLVARYAHDLEKKIGSVNILLLIGSLPIIGFFGMGKSAGLVGIIFCFSFQLCRGLNQVILKDALNARVESQMRATANSIIGLGMRVVFIIFGPILGWLIDNKGYEISLNIFGAIFIVSFFIILLPLIKLRGEFRK
ncbi:MFS transporter [Halobacteriovorax marinus]|nr:MFS transporter [Halobacteriovorax marinus]